MKARGIVTASLIVSVLGAMVVAEPIDRGVSVAIGTPEDRTAWLAAAHQSGCCVGLTGNVDCDGSDGVDISDLSALIDYLYISFTPLCCPGEANVDGDPAAGIDISDLSALIDYLYISFTPPASCGIEFSSYAAQVQPIFTNSCAVSGCHRGAFPNADLDLSAGNSYVNLVNITSSGYAPAKRVVPADTLASVLYHKVKGTGVYGPQMPAFGSITADEIKLIILWIAAGAPNN
jgi:hypothetical protein